MGYLLDVLTLPLPLQEDEFNPFLGEMHWSCLLRMFTWPFYGATIVSEGAMLDAGDQGYCLLNETDVQAGQSCAFTLSVARIVRKWACFLTLQTQSCKCWGNSGYLNFMYLPVFNSGSK